MQCVGDPSLIALVEEEPQKSQIHVVPYKTFNWYSPENYLREHTTNLTRALVITPSGWQSGSRLVNSYISYLTLQTAEHCSYSELEDFVRFLKSEEAISTVPVIKNELWRVSEVPAEWLGANDVVQ